MKTIFLLKKNGWLLTILLFVFAAATAQAAPGDLDPTFNGTGKLRVGVGGGYDYANAMARQSDNKLIVAGQGGNGFSLVRYNTNGTLDTTFGSGGKVQTLIGSAYSGANAVAVLSDGKILAAGFTKIFSSPGTSDFALVKYNSNGTLDTTFGTGGIVTTDFFNGDDLAYAMAVQTDGKIVLAGKAAFSSTFDFGAIARYSATGALDNTFDGDGKVTTIYNDSASDNAVLLFNGKIYTAGDVNGTGNFASYLTCYNSNGAPNTAFEGDGTAYLSNPGSTRAASLTVLGVFAGEEKLIVAGSSDASSSQSYQTLWSYDAYNGSLDTSFGSGGRATLNVAGTRGSAVRILNLNGVASRIVVAGTISNGTGISYTTDFLAARYQLNGALDTTFDGDGIATADFNPNDYGRAVLIQPTDNKIVVAGSTVLNQFIGETFASGDGDFGIVRFNTNGALDTTFDVDGKRLDDVSNGSSAASAVKIQADGKIVVAGNAGNPGIAARFNTDGTFDTTFDGDGIKKLPICCIEDMAIQPDGKIVLASRGYQFTVYRLNADGSPDTSFDGDGLAFAAIGDDYTNLEAMAIQPDGAIVLVGYSNAGSFNSPNIDFAVVRFLPNGSLDLSFDSDGKVTTAISAGSDAANAVVIQADGKIVVAGYSGIDTDADFAVVRYNPNGSLDTSFSGDGRLTTSIATSIDFATAVALQTNGKIVVAGYASNGSNYDFAAARYNTDGALDTTFDGDGKLTTPIGTLNDIGIALAIQSDGKILVAGSSENAASTNDFAVVRYNTNGSLDNSYSSDGKVTVDLSGASDSADAIALDSSGRAVVAGFSDGLFGIVRLLGNLSPTAAAVSVSGRVLTPTGRGLMNATVSLTDGSGNTRATQTSAFGYYRFDEVEAGQSYILSVRSKRYQFNPQVLSVSEDTEQLNFVAGQSNSKPDYK